MSWSDIGGGGASNFLTFEPNKAKKLHILLADGEEPVSYATHWIPQANNGKGQSANCPGQGCPLCADRKAYPIRMRHAVKVFDYESGQVKVLENSNPLFKALKGIYDTIGSFVGIDVVITRKGTDRNTEYSVVNVPTTFPGCEDESGVDLNNLATPTPVEDIAILMNGGTVQRGGDDAPAPAKPAAKPAPAKPAPVAQAAPAPKKEHQPSRPPAEGAVSSAPEAPEERKKLTEEINKNFISMSRYEDPMFIKNDLFNATSTPENPDGKPKLTDFTVKELRKLLQIQELNK